MKAPTLLITIDAEEDEWGEFDRPDYGVANIARLAGLQEIFDRYEYRATYVITTPVAEDDGAVRLLGSIHERGGCEIGAHCHPWNSPPFVEERSPHNSMLCNLPASLQVEKVGQLREAIARNLGVDATSFRAGRWGANAELARGISSLGFVVDSSVTPHVNWACAQGPDFDRSYPECYRVSLEDLAEVDPTSALAEVPVTIGFTGLLRRGGERLNRAFSAGAARAVRARGIATRLGLFRRSWLCPELAGASEMIRLTESLVASGRSILNFMFHSGALMAGKTPYVRTAAEEGQFLRRIERYLQYCRAKGFVSATLTEVGNRAFHVLLAAVSLA